MSQMMKSKMPLISQPTAAMTRKQFWSTVAGSAMVIAMWATKTFAGVVVPADVASAATGILMAVIGYVVRDRVS